MATAKHLYWAVSCHNKKCRQHLLLKYIGIYEQNKVPVLMESPESLELDCVACGQKHTYTRTDIKTVVEESESPRSPEPHSGD